MAGIPQHIKSRLAVIEVRQRPRPSHDMAEPGADNMNSRRKRIVDGHAKSHVEARRH
jgi:hypothetical protein